MMRLVTAVRRGDCQAALRELESTDDAMRASALSKKNKKQKKTNSRGAWARRSCAFALARWCAVDAISPRNGYTALQSVVDAGCDPSVIECLLSRSACPHRRAVNKKAHNCFNFIQSCTEGARKAAILRLISEHTCSLCSHVVLCTRTFIHQYQCHTSIMNARVHQHT